MLLEREHELELLTGLLRDVGMSGGRVVLIRGEAGIGKSALVREVIDQVGGRAHILVGYCDDLLTPRPLDPFRDMGRDEPSLAQAFEAMDRSRVMDTVLGLLSRELRPTLMVIEDTQWADAATLDVISYVGRRIEQANGLLVLILRDAEVDLDHPLRSVLGSLPPDRVARIRLEGLSSSAVTTLIAGSNLDPAEVMSITGGNPFLVTGMASVEAGVVPSSVQDSVMARVKKLSANAWDLLKVLSVIPQSVSSVEMFRLGPEADAGLEEGERAGLLDVDGESIGFHHELTRRAVEASLTEAERVAMNRLVLRNLPTEADLARLVHHARGAQDIDRLLEEAPKAARAAMELESPREAVDHFRQLTPYVGRLTPEVKGQILEDWVWAENMATTSTDASVPNELALEHYRATGDRGGQSRTLATAALHAEWTGQRDMAERLADEALEVLGSAPHKADLVRALETKSYLALMAADAAAAIQWADRALALADSDVDESLLIRCLIHKATAANIRYPKGIEALDEARLRAEASGVWREAYRALINVADIAVDFRDLDTASEYAQAAIAVGEEHEMWGTARYAEAAYTRVLEHRGEWDKAEELARDLMGSYGLAKLISLPIIGSIEARQGRAASRQTVRRAWDKAIVAAEIQRIWPAAAALAEYAWISGDHEVPFEEIKDVMRAVLDIGWTWDAGLTALWLWKLGELEEAPEGIAEPYRLLMEGDALAAAQIFEERGIPYERAIALMHGDREAALQALEILEDLGATGVADRLRQELRARGVSMPHRVTRHQGPGLTPRQSEVLGLLVEGLSNIEIADRLFLSPRTVEHHVAAVMSKLDASSRLEAVEKARESGLLIV